MINVMLYKREHSILLSMKSLNEYRFDKSKWVEMIYGDEKHQYITDLYVTDAVAEKIMYFLQESECNIFNSNIRNMREQFEKLIKARDFFKLWMKSEEVITEDMIDYFDGVRIISGDY